METLNNGSEHRSEASNISVGSESSSNQQGPKKSRRRRKKGGKGSSGTANGEAPKTPAAPSTASSSKQGVAGRSKSPKAGGGHSRGHRKKQKQPPAMTVIVNSVYLWDIVKKHEDENAYQAHQDSYHNRHHRHDNHQHQVASYRFCDDVGLCSSNDQDKQTSVSTTPFINTVRAPHDPSACRQHVVEDGGFSVIDTSFPNPHPSSVVHDKYWCQRRRLFSRFDMGVQLDSEGWFSVTPEIIADHVAQRVGDLADSAVLLMNNGERRGIVVLDAFCGCGGNAIAFGKIPPEKISLVVCVDIDRSKLRMAAYNASLYDIPNDKLIFIECNTMFVLMNCYRNGELVLDKLDPDIPNMPSPVETEVYAGYTIGGLESLPPRIDAVFADPPWGGENYSQQNSYDLEKHMKIRVGPVACSVGPSKEPEADPGVLSDDFFDTFSSKPSRTTGRKTASRGLYSEASKDSEYANGAELVKMAAAATSSHLVIYDLPRNTTKTSLGQAALKAGYRGNIKLEEHYLNGRLKTVTAYLGDDYCSLLLD